jgi:uncharacterized NAD-dependent epimerase/dehydratase family protein
MDAMFDGDAVVWCEGAFAAPEGKTAHGLVRFTRRYRVHAVIDSTLAGRDAGEVLDGVPCGIPIVADLAEALEEARVNEVVVSHFVVGLAPDGGRLPAAGREAVKQALRLSINVDCGLHDFLTEDLEMIELAARFEAQLRDVRKPPPRSELHHFSGRIEEVGALVVALLGTDSAVGKRTTAWKLVDGFTRRGLEAVMIGTGQTAWMQGAPYGIVLDSIVNDFVSGELEHAVLSAWDQRRPDVIVVEGQGSLMNPAYPGGFEILAACRPGAVVLQHAPHRREYDGFPGYPIHPLAQQIDAIELISGRPVVAVTVNHEGMRPEDVPEACAEIARETGLPCCDPLLQTMDEVLDAVLTRLEAPPYVH